MFARADQQRSDPAAARELHCIRGPWLDLDEQVAAEQRVHHSRDLLVEIEPGTAEALEFARSCRIRSLLVGSGEHPSAPGRYGLGAVPANPTARVDGFSYELWTWGHACDSLWQTCEYVAHAEAGAGTAESTLDRVLPAVQLLLANGAAYLDESRDN